MKSLFKIYNEGEKIPHKFTIGRKYIENDRALSWFIVVPSIFKEVRGYNDPDSFRYYPYALVRKLYMIRIRFPQYQKVLFKKQTTYSLVKKDADI